MKVAVMGYGTVGSGVCEVIETHQDTLAKRTGGKALELARILDLREFPGDKHEALFTKDFNDILNDPEIQIVAETMGGVNPAFDFTMKLLASGKSVVTSNKELVAQNMRQHDPQSPFLIGHSLPGDVIHQAQQESWVENQLSLFDLL